MSDFHFFWNGPFSQWYPCTFAVESWVLADGLRVEYNCAEQYMMAEKARLFGDDETLQKIMASSDPREQKRLGRSVKNFDPAKWDAVCMDVVGTGNFAKFHQNQKLWDFIRSTDDKVLVEASPYDAIWGIGYSEQDAPNVPQSQWGKNLLGICLMDVRHDLKG